MSKFLAGERLLRTQDATDSVEKTDRTRTLTAATAAPLTATTTIARPRNWDNDPLRKTQEGRLQVA